MTTQEGTKPRAKISHDTESSTLLLSPRKFLSLFHGKVQSHYQHIPERKTVYWTAVFFKVKKTSEDVELIDGDLASKLAKIWMRFTGE